MAKVDPMEALKALKWENSRGQLYVFEKAKQLAKHLRQVADVVEAAAAKNDLDAIANKSTYLFADTEEVRHMAELIRVLKTTLDCFEAEQ